MTHQHEWDYDIRYKPGMVECKFVCVECGEEMNGEEALRRLNATEDLSADVAIQCTHAMMGDPLYAVGEEALVNYAKTRKGE
jgi:DNA-directed RNA polymerase subunit RPC12/RpoP